MGVKLVINRCFLLVECLRFQMELPYLIMVTFSFSLCPCGMMTVIRRKLSSSLKEITRVYTRKTETDPFQLGKIVKYEKQSSYVIPHKTPAQPCKLIVR